MFHLFNWNLLINSLFLYIYIFLFSRIANPAFKNLPKHVFVESTIKLLNVMEKFDNQPIEVKNLMHRLTLDVLGKAAFGFDFNV